MFSDHRVSKLFTCLATILGLAHAGKALADKPSILFDFERSTVTVYGAIQNDNTKTGLESEVAARKNGVQTMSDYLDKSCQGTPAWTPKRNTQISKALKSQGSEIYANGTLRIILSAPLKNVFDTEGTPQALKAGNYQNIGFKLPLIPGEILDCGKVPMDIGTDTPIGAHFVSTPNTFGPG